MLSRIPFALDKLAREDLDREVLRTAIIAEFDAINLYEQLASLTVNEVLKKVLLDVAREEKTHVGEFQTLLVELDQEQKKELENGRAEVEEFR